MIPATSRRASTIGGTATSRPAARDAFGSWVAAAVIVAAIACSFANALQSDFVYDDRLLIVDNPAIRAPLSDWRALRSYRPLRTLSYRLDYAIGGLNPTVFHATNLVYHAVAAILVNTIATGLGASPSAALIGALIFAVHPVQTDSVTYAAGRRDILCGLFYAAGFVAYLRYRDRRSTGALVGAIACYVLALLAKEMAITLPLICLAYDRFTMARGSAPSTSSASSVDDERSEQPRPPQMRRARERTRHSGSGSTRDSLPRAMPTRPGTRIASEASGGVINQMGVYRLLAVTAGVGAVVAAAVYGRFIGKVIAVTGWHGGSVGANVATVLRVWVHYVSLVVWPARLSADYSPRAFPVSTTLLDPRALAAACVLGAMAAVAAWAWRRERLAGFGAAWWGITLLPVSHLVPYRELMAEHYLYVPMIGVAVIAASMIDEARAVAPARTLLAGAAVLVVAAALRTVVRNRDWHDAVTLWTATVATVPECARARFNLGQAYFERVRLADAEREWLAAAAITPKDLDTELALAALYYREGRFDDAERWIGSALAIQPDDARVQGLAGWIALDAGDPARALPRFDAALASAATAMPGRHQRERAAAREGAQTGRERASAALARRGGVGAPR